LYRGDSLWQFQIGLYCTLVRSPPPSLPLEPLPVSLKTIARGFFVLFHVSIWSPSTIYPHLNFLHSPFHPHKYPSRNTASILQSCLSLFIFKSMFKEVSQLSEYTLFLSIQPFFCSPLPFYPSPIFQQLSVHIIISSTFTDVMFYDIVDALSFSFPFPPSLSSIE
jgi:hypothetical protein